MIANYIKPIKVFYLLSTTLILVLWLEQRSINAYWVQTYHKASPLTKLDKYSSWEMGGLITKLAVQQLDKAKEQLDDFNTTTVAALNERLVTLEPDELSVYESLSTHKKDWVFNFNIKSLIYINKPLVIYRQPIVTFDPPYPPIQTNLIITATVPINPEKTTSSEQDKIVLPEHLFLLEKGQKVFFVGDSLMQGVAPYAMRTLLKQHGIESINLSKQSTGLSYPNFFNWPKVAQETFKNNPDIKLMVVFMGANDPWDFPVIRGARFFRFRNSEWEGVYRSRIQRLINTATANNTRVLWVGIPNMRDPKLNAGIIRLNKIYQSQVTIANQQYIASNDILGMSNDTYVNFIKLPKRGNVTLRTDDGIHFTVTGQKLISDKILSLLRFKESMEEVPQ